MSSTLHLSLAGRFLLPAVLFASCGGTPASFQTPTPASAYEDTFILCWYPPLQAEYDPTLWTDVAPLEEGGGGYCFQHFLQSRSLQSCTIFEQGPSDLNADVPPETISLNTTTFALTVLTDLEPGITHAWYVEQTSIAGFSYEFGAPLLRARSLTSEWAECQKQAEALLGTLHMPQP